MQHVILNDKWKLLLATTARKYIVDNKTSVVDGKYLSKKNSFVSIVETHKASFFEPVSLESSDTSKH